MMHFNDLSNVRPNRWHCSSFLLCWTNAFSYKLYKFFQLTINMTHNNGCVAQAVVRLSGSEIEKYLNNVNIKQEKISLFGVCMSSLCYCGFFPASSKNPTHLPLVNTCGSQFVDSAICLSCAPPKAHRCCHRLQSLTTKSMEDSKFIENTL